MCDVNQMACDEFGRMIIVVITLRAFVTRLTVGRSVSQSVLLMMAMVCVFRLPSGADRHCVRHTD